MILFVATTDQGAKASTVIIEEFNSPDSLVTKLTPWILSHNFMDECCNNFANAPSLKISDCLYQ
jgi:hypothetical protein